jgi:hypothetical protein
MLTLSGVNFGPVDVTASAATAPRVKLGDVACAHPVHVDDGTLRCSTLKALTAGPVAVTVTVGKGNAAVQGAQVSCLSSPDPDGRRSDARPPRPQIPLIECAAVHSLSAAAD